MSSKDINTGITKSIEKYVEEAGDTPLAQQIGRRLKRIPGLENVLNIQLHSICYESLCRFWENAERNGKSLVSTVNGVEVTVSDLVLCDVFGFKNVDATSEPSKAASSPEEFWIEMVKDKSSKFSAKELLSSFYKEYDGLSKVISKCILVQIGSHDSLSWLKLYLMEIICKQRLFNWAEFISGLMADHYSTEVKLEETAKRERTSRFRRTKSFGFILQVILDHFKVPKIAVVDVNAMKIRHGKKATGETLVKKRKQIKLVVEPTKATSFAEKSAEEIDVSAELRSKKLADRPMSAGQTVSAEQSNIAGQEMVKVLRKLVKQLPPPPVKQTYVKKRKDTSDDDDEIPLVQRLKKPRIKQTEEHGIGKNLRIFDIPSQGEHVVDTPSMEHVAAIGKEVVQTIQDHVDTVTADEPNSLEDSVLEGDGKAFVSPPSTNTEDIFEISEEERLKSWIEWRSSRSRDMIFMARTMHEEEDWVFELLGIQNLNELVSFDNLLHDGLKILENRKKKSVKGKDMHDGKDDKPDDDDSDENDQDDANMRKH